MLFKLVGCLSSFFTPKMACSPKEVFEAAHSVLGEKFDALIANNGRELSAEYTFIVDEECSEPCIAAELRSNTKKNRYLNVLPFDFNRVKLKGNADYINASLLESPAGAEPSWRYVAAQGPLAETTADFWHMVQDCCCAAIVMLTRTVEARHVKCADYFPSEKGAEMSCGGFTVKVLDLVDISADITQRTLQIINQKEGTCRNLTHFWYHNWPDHGVPESTKCLRQLCTHLHHSGTSDPLLVHCSAGIGRTGTFCTVDIIMRRLRWLAQNAITDPTTIRKAVDVQRVVEDLRRQRRGMVQTLDQYYFCYRTIMEELRSHL